MRKISIGIVDSQTLFRKGLVALLYENENFKVLFEVGKEKSLCVLLESQQPDIIIMELKLNLQNGVQIAELVKKKYPNIKIIILTSFYNNAFINIISRIGINAFISKDIQKEELYEAINAVFKDRIYITEAYKDIVLYSKGADLNSLHSKFSVVEKLTDRELEILTLICHEYTNVEISEKLYLSIRTVEGHRNNLLSKTGVKNTVGLVLYAIVNKLVKIDLKLLQVTIRRPYVKGYIMS